MDVMSNLDGLISIMGPFGFVVFILSLFVFLILIPFSVYSAQKWAYRSYKELRLIRQLLESGVGNSQGRESEHIRRLATRRTPTLGDDIED
jgi:hypothetical protein